MCESKEINMDKNLTVEKKDENKQVEKFSPKDIAVKETGEIQTVNFEQQYKLAQFYVRSGMLPKQYNSPEKVIAGMQYARELGLKQLTALRQITVINGTPSLFGDLPLAMVRASGQLESIKESLAKGIQRIQAAHPNIQVPVAAQIDTNEIVSELKQTISQEISKEIKNLSQDIVSKILSNLPTGTVSSTPLRSAGQISDIGTPSIEIVEGAPREKPKRPKLDDMLDSIIVSE